MLPIVFILITIISIVLFYWATGKNKWVLILSFLWMLVLGIASGSQFFENTAAKPPRFLFVLLGSVVLYAFIYKQVQKNKLNARLLLAIHILRIPVELILYQLFLLKMVPVLMTYKGWNFDIVMGISATLLLIWLLFFKKALSPLLVKWWNVAGLVFLTAIVCIAILSSPLPMQLLAFEQPNIAVLQFPYIYLPAVIVPIVYLSHFLALQKEATNRI